MCGGVASSGGSSPLTRGKPVIELVDASRRGLIPAHAGKTPLHAVTRLRARAHPRSRGENCRTPSQRPSRTGSSPLTRGKPSHPPARGLAAGLIPAHAGKTQRLEKNEMLWPGSSPLTRGKRFLCQERDAAAGLIPAHAGKTAHAPTQRQPSPAHPRSRGENTVGVEDSCLTAGSSPLTRGKLCRAADALPEFRLIPAHAGKTGWEAGVCGAPRAHPRSRGENVSVRH